ncbi:MAG: DUF4405 domain-containing protein [Chlorobium sp.]|jgi:hypothetical protein|nr:DUF4405 domain-containing protein [Chlorobium sp.]
MSTSIKSWATPLAVGAFTISAVTGLLIFFDIEIGLVEPTHKWLSWFLVCGVALHVISNWKQFTSYFSKKPAIGIIGAALIVTIAAVLPIFGEEEEKENPAKMAAYALASSSIETVALVVKTTPMALVEQLGKKGIVVNDPAATVEQIAKSNGKEAKEVLGDILASTKGTAKNDDKD